MSRSNRGNRIYRALSPRLKLSILFESAAKRFGHNPLTAALGESTILIEQ
jgi:hypothetical protein